MFFFLVFILSILFTIDPTNLKNLSEKHDQISINLTNVFDHGLTTSLPVFLFLIYLFILNISIYISVYILMIYKWFKIRAWFAFWLNISETQPSKYFVKNRNTIFLDSTLFFKFPSSRHIWNARVGKALIVCDWYGFFLHSGCFSVWRVEMYLSYFELNNPLFTFSGRDFSVLNWLNQD